MNVRIKLRPDEESIGHCSDGMVELEEAEIKSPSKRFNEITIHRIKIYITSHHSVRRTDYSSTPC